MQRLHEVFNAHRSRIIDSESGVDYMGCIPLLQNTAPMILHAVWTSVIRKWREPWGC